jgi:uncharacterized surface protein with fasciclin (FAS1) repeats
MMKVKRQIFTSLMCLLFISGAVFAQTADQYEREMKKRIAAGQITMAEVEAKIESGEIKRFGQVFVNPRATVLGNLTRSKLHVTISEAIVTTEYKEVLDGEGTGAYTVFAPRDESFAALEEGALAEMMEEGNEDELKAFAGNHIVKGNYTLANIIKAIEEGKGRGEVTTLSGMRLYFFKRGPKYMVVDEKGTKSYITNPDAVSVNGVIHDIDKVLQTK